MVQSSVSSDLPEWEYLPGGWPKPAEQAAGWSHPSIVRTMLDRWPAFSEIVRSTKPLGIFPLAPQARSESAHNLAMTFGYLLARAAYGRKQISVLDWGGALGHYPLIGQALLPEIPLDITILDLPDLCAAGRELLPDVTFTTNDDECFGRRYDVVIASNSIQYVEEWRAILHRLVITSDQWLLVTRLPVVCQSPSFVVIQRPYGYGYQTEYVSWVFNRLEFLSQAENFGAVLEREFIAGGRTHYAGGEEASETVGFLFRVPFRQDGR
jgi:putative methyltransferase (TIGR04325 family)